MELKRYLLTVKIGIQEKPNTYSGNPIAGSTIETVMKTDLRTVKTAIEELSREANTKVRDELDYLIQTENIE